MTIQMNDSQLNTIESLGSFIKGSPKIDFKGQGRTEVYGWLQATLIKFSYPTLSKKDKGTLKKYLSKVTGYSRSQVTRLIRKQTETGYVRAKSQKRYRFPKKYSRQEVTLLAKTDRLHEYPNGNALKVILKRLAVTFGLVAFVNLSKISVSHIYNLRKSREYLRINKDYTPTKPAVDRNIGERAKPNPSGRPGYIRVDSVHQGDLAENGQSQKGVYHINTVDEVTQMEFAGAVEKISEAYLIPLLKRLLDAYPFKIIEFHSDNGSEYINFMVAKLLNQLLVRLTKSRSRRTNDNALVEGKNGSIIRKWIGYSFIEGKHAGKLNEFYFGCFNEYVNYHRPCGFYRIVKDPRKVGKIKKDYPLENYQTPYDKLRGLENVNQYLKPGITLEKLDKISKRYDDNQMAEIVQRERSKLFEEVLFDERRRT